MEILYAAGVVFGLVVFVALVIGWVFLPFIISGKLNKISNQLAHISELLEAANRQRYAISELEKPRAPEGIPVNTSS